jgi:hypothetical protein
LIGHTVKRWGVLWHSRNALDGDRQHLMHGAIFETRREARAYIEAEYGYIRTRSDLRREPHGWHMPKAVRVSITTEVLHEHQP